MKVFLAMVRHNLGRSTKEMQSLLALLAAASSDRGVQATSRAIAISGQDVERTWA